MNHHTLLTECAMNTFFESFPTADITESNRILHTPSNFAKSSLFYMQEAGTLKSLKSHLCQRKNLDSFLFLIVLSGKGVLTVNERVYALSANDCAFINCNQQYSHQSSENEPWELMWVHFNGLSALSYHKYFLDKFESHAFHADTINSFTSIITHLMEIHKKKDYITEINASKLITDILTLSFTIQQQQKELLNDNISKKLELIKDYININFRQKITLDHLSEQFYISKFHLSREFKQMYGVTIGNYILAQRITYAKELLRFTNNSIETISEACGIPDTSYFNKVFRKSENMTATQYRKSWTYKKSD